MCAVTSRQIATFAVKEREYKSTIQSLNQSIDRLQNEASIAHSVHNNEIASLHTKLRAASSLTQSMNDSNVRLQTELSNALSNPTIECAVCLNRVNEAVRFEPCNHITVCGDCAPALLNDRCPRCTRTVTAIAAAKL